MDENDFDHKIDKGIAKALDMYQKLRLIADSPKESYRILVNLICFTCCSVSGRENRKAGFDFIVEYLMSLEEKGFDGFMNLCYELLEESLENLPNDQ